MVLFAAALPVSVTVLSLVMPSPATPLSFEKETIVGALGAAGADTVAATAVDATPVLPATSMALAVKLWLPLDSELVV